MDKIYTIYYQSGMWGFYSSRNRELAQKLYKKILNKSLALKYNQNNRKGLDQFFLSGKWNFFKLKYYFLSSNLI